NESGVIDLSASFPANQRREARFRSVRGGLRDCRVAALAGFPPIVSTPPMYGRRTFGTVTVPSGRWKFSRIATMHRLVATRVLFRVWTKDFSPPIFPARRF